MHNLLNKHQVVGAVDDVNIDSGASVLELVFANPVIITRVGFIVTTAVVNAAGAVKIDLKRRPVVGANANQVALMTFTLTGTTTRAAGAVCWKDCVVLDKDGEIAEDGSQRNEAPNSNIVGPLAKFDPMMILPGQSLELSVSEAADSGAGRYFVEYITLPFDGQPVHGTNIFEDVTDQ